MKRLLFHTLLWLCLLYLAPSVAQAKVRIVTTNTDLAAIADAIGGEHVSVTSLAKQNQNPHDVDARPSFLVPLSRADLLILAGLDLESGRSEEHTSELQSRGHLVCRLLLEKK